MTAFNGARIDTKVSLNEGNIGLGGGWVKTGNLLGAGGGDKLGSKDNFGWQMIVSNITYGGFNDDGSFYLTEGTADPDIKFTQLVKQFETIDNTPEIVFSKAITDLRVFKFSFSLVYLSDDGVNWGSFKREILVFRDGALNKTKETTPYTEKIGNSNISAEYTLTGTTLNVEFIGANASNIKGSCYINFHGIKNP